MSIGCLGESTTDHTFLTRTPVSLSSFLPQDQPGKLNDLLRAEYHGTDLSTRIDEIKRKKAAMEKAGKTPSVGPTPAASTPAPQRDTVSLQALTAFYLAWGRTDKLSNVAALASYYKVPGFSLHAFACLGIQGLYFWVSCESCDC